MRDGPLCPQMYNFTSFTVTLNELQPGMERMLAPTDCRLRPDIRSMENGDMGACLCGGLGVGLRHCGEMAQELRTCPWLVRRPGPTAPHHRKPGTWVWFSDGSMLSPARAAPYPDCVLGLDLASQEKERLEEKQREARRERDKGDTEWQTR